MGRKDKAPSVMLMSLVSCEATQVSARLTKREKQSRGIDISFNLIGVSCICRPDLAFRIFSASSSLDQPLIMSQTSEFPVATPRHAILGTQTKGMTRLRYRVGGLVRCGEESRLMTRFSSASGKPWGNPQR